MEGCLVLYSSLMILLVASAHGRIAVPDIDKVVTNNLITKDFIPDIKPIVNLNVTYIDLSNITNVPKVVPPINLNVTTKRCSHHAVDVTDNEIDADDTEPCDPKDKVDVGPALILTPYIEEGRTLEGRKASAVDPDLFLGVRSYSGFFTVNKTYDSNTFFWYFPVENKPVNETPWIIWLQGGPGASSLIGLFDEIGPFKYNEHSSLKLQRNPYTWLQNHSLLFIDNPVGVGYSFTNHLDGLVQDMGTYSAHMYSALTQFLQLFPELRTAPLFIAGESYAGKYVPSLGLEIHTHKDSPGGDMNFKGLIIGNAYVDPSVLLAVPRSFYNVGMLSIEQMELLKPLTDAFQQAIATNNSVEAKQKWTEVVTSLLLLSHQNQGYNFLQDHLQVGKYQLYLKDMKVRRALHVGLIKYTAVNITVNMAMAPEFLSSAKYKFETLLNHYRVLAICGQLDQLLACPPTSEQYRTWKWDQSAQFRNATRTPYIYRRRLLGYHMSGGGLTEAIIRGAGHMAAADAPGALARLVSRWTRALPLDSAPSYNHTFISEFIRNATTAL